MSSWKDAPIVESAPESKTSPEWMSAPVVEDTPAPAQAPAESTSAIRDRFNSEIGAGKGIVDKAVSLPGQGVRYAAKTAKGLLQIPGDILTTIFDSDTPPPDGEKASAFEIGRQQVHESQKLWDWDRGDASIGQNLDAVGKGGSEKVLVDRFSKAVKDHDANQAKWQSAMQKRGAVGSFLQQTASMMGPTGETMLSSVIGEVGVVPAFDYWIRQGYGSFVSDGLKRYGVDPSTLNADQVRKIDTAAKQMAALYSGVEFIQEAVPGAPGMDLVKKLSGKFPWLKGIIGRTIGRTTGESVEEGGQQGVQEAFDARLAGILGDKLDAKQKAAAPTLGSAWSSSWKTAVQSFPTILMAFGVPGAIIDQTQKILSANPEDLAPSSDISAWAAQNPEKAKELAGKPAPTRKDFEEAGLPRMPAAERAKVAQDLSAMAATPATEEAAQAPEAPPATEAPPAPVEGQDAPAAPAKKAEPAIPAEPEVETPDEAEQADAEAMPDEDADIEDDGEGEPAPDVKRGSMMIDSKGSIGPVVSSNDKTITIAMEGAEDGKSELVTYDRSELTQEDGAKMSDAELAETYPDHFGEAKPKAEKPATPAPKIGRKGVTKKAAPVDAVTVVEGKDAPKGESLPEKPVVASAPVKVEGKPVTHADTTAFFRKAKAEPVTAKEAQELYAGAKANKDSIVAEIRAMLDVDPRTAKKRKATKDEIAQKSYESRMRRFATLATGGFMWSPMSETIEQASDRHVADLTNESIKAEFDKNAADMAAKKKAIENPETLDEFNTFVAYQGTDALTPEQKAKFDGLKAEAGMSAREDRAIKNKGTIEKVSGASETPMEIVERPHEKRGNNVFIVTMGDRVSGDTFKELAGKARALGGNWTRAWKPTDSPAGFSFNDRKAAEDFMELRKGDVSRVEDVRESKEETKEAAAGRLSDMADKMEADGTESLGRDRQSNTAKRARQADSSEADARAKISMARTIRNIAAAVKDGRAKFLKNIRTRTQIETIEGIARDTRERLDADRGYGPVRPELAQYPATKIHGDSVLSLVGKLEKIAGAKMAAIQLRKYAGQSGMVDIPRELAEKILEKAPNDAGWYIDDQLKNIKRLEAMNIANDAELRSAIREYLDFKGDAPAENKAQSLRRKIVGQNVGIDYFPTPPALAGEVVRKANIRSGDSVLEPSAGDGQIANRIRAEHPEAELKVVEQSGTLRNILKAEGHDVVGDDFMDHTEKYDKIVMNPPFSGNLDIQHVRHAFGLLKPGGRLVAIMSEHGFFGKEKEAVEFRDWLESLAADIEKNPDNSFMDRSISGPTTGVNTRTVVIDKPADKIGKKGVTKATDPIATRKDLTAPEGVTREDALKALSALSGRDLVNLETGIVAQVNNVQRDKILSNPAVRKSNDNGFAANKHNAAASIIDRLWKHAVLLDERSDRAGDKNIASIKRFAAPILFNGETAIAYITAKESVSAGHRIYSLELTEIEKLRSMGGTLDERTATGASVNKIANMLAEVKSAEGHRHSVTSAGAVKSDRTNVDSGIKTEIAPDGEKTISVPAKDREGLPAKEQKKYLLAELDKAIDEAPEEAVELEATPEQVSARADKALITKPEFDYSLEGKALEANRVEVERLRGLYDQNIEDTFAPLLEKYAIPTESPAEAGYMNMENVLTGSSPAEALTPEARRALLSKKLEKLSEPKFATVTIEVPGDGEFTLVNKKSTLQAFQKKAKSQFPAAAPKADSYALPSSSTPGIQPVKAAPDRLKGPLWVKLLEPFASTDPQREFLFKPWQGKDKMMVATDGRRLAVALGISGKPANGNYPNFQQVIPGGQAGKLPDITNMKSTEVADTETFMRQIRQAKIGGTSERSNAISFFMGKDGKVIVAARELEGGQYQSGDAKSGEVMFHMNPDFILEAITFLRQAGNESATIAWTDESTPALFLGKKEFVVQMPFKAGNDASEYSDYPTQPKSPYPKGPGTGQGPGGGPLNRVGWVIDNASGKNRLRGLLDTLKNSPVVSDTSKEDLNKLDPTYEEQNTSKIKERVLEWLTEDPSPKELKARVDEAEMFLRDTETDLDFKGAVGVALLEHYKNTGNDADNLALVEYLDPLMRGAGRLIQAANMVNGLTGNNWVRKLTKYLSERGVKLPDDVQDEVEQGFRDAAKMRDATKRAQAIHAIIAKVSAYVPFKAGEWLDAYRYTNMLSNPQSHERNVYGNTVQALITRPLSLMGNGDFSGAGRYFTSALTSVLNGDAILAAKDSFREDFGKWADTLGDPNASIFDAIRREQGPKGKGAAVAWKSLTAIPKILQAQDAYFGAMIEAGEVARLVEKGVSAVEAQQIAHRLAEKYLYRTRFGMLRDASLPWASQALDGLSNLLEKGRTTENPFIRWPMKFAVPFLRTPMRIAQFGVESSPLAWAGTGMTRQRIAKAEFGKSFDSLSDEEKTIVNEDFKNRVGLAAVGTMVSLMGLGFALLGKTTWAPPDDKKERDLFYASGRRPYAFYAGGKWIPMAYLGPFFIAFAIPAAARNAFAENPKLIDKTFLDKLWSAASGIPKIILNQTPTAGVNGLLELLQGKSDRSIAQTAGFQVGQFVPASGLLRWMTKVTDPVYRKPVTVAETIAAGIPGLSDDLKAIQDKDGTIAERDWTDLYFPYTVGDASPDSGDYVKELMARKKQSILMAATDPKATEAEAEKAAKVLADMDYDQRRELLKAAVKGQDGKIGTKAWQERIRKLRKLP